MIKFKTAHWARGALLALPVLLAVGCGGGAPAEGGTSAERVTVTNCDQEVEFPSPAQRLFVNDGNLIALTLAIGAKDQIAAVSSLQRDADILQRKYGDVVKELNDVAPEYPTMESVLAAKPDVMVAGWSYGYTESKNLTPDTLAEHDIDAYILSESCRREDGARGTMDPWEAVTTDLTNLGAITGHQDTAGDVVVDTEKRLAALREAPQGKEKPVVFVFDSGTDAILSSGAYGGPHAIIEAGGGVNALADVEDTWTQVTWEKFAKSSPDMIVFVDYGEQSFEDKQKVLAAHPASKNLPAVKEKRYLNLPYAMWTSGPLNIDAAEHMRRGLEKYDLVPGSDITPELELGE